jgi:sec-independent protein translocase protein TatB
MLDLSFGEMLIIGVLALVVVGPEKLPEMLRYLGKMYGRISRASMEFRRAFMAEADRADAAERAAELKKRREEARRRAEEARARALAQRAESAGAAPPGPAQSANAEPAPLEPAVPAQPVGGEG